MGNSATPPSGGLASNSNYLLNSNDGSELKNVLVTIDVTQALIGNIGFSFQLNAYSKSPDTSAWQQYNLIVETPNGLVSGASPGQLYNQIEPWPASTAGLGVPTTGGDLINDWVSMLTLPESGLPAGYQLSISLGTDAGNNV